MAAVKTSLSAGELIRSVLLSDPNVSRRVKKIYPVVTDNADLPYILYRHTSLEPMATKGGISDVVEIELQCCTEKYAEGIALAEAVRAALDGKQATYEGLTMRHCLITGYEGLWDSGAHIQTLTITAKIS